MIIESWIVMAQTDLDTLWTQAKGDNPPADLGVLTNGVRGYWRNILPDEVANVIGAEAEMDAFLAAHGALVKSVDSWVQGQGVDYITPGGEFTTDPDRILSLMPDIIVADGGTIPPTFENPNWAHVFLGQPPDLKIFAGSFTIDFTTEFL